MSNWSAEDHKALEDALRQTRHIPGSERWSKISEIVGRPRAECVARYQSVRDSLKQKRLDKEGEDASCTSGTAESLGAAHRAATETGNQIKDKTIPGLETNESAAEAYTQESQDKASSLTGALKTSQGSEFTEAEKPKSKPGDETQACALDGADQRSMADAPRRAAVGSSAQAQPRARGRGTAARGRRVAERDDEKDRQGDRQDGQHQALSQFHTGARKTSPGSGRGPLERVTARHGAPPAVEPASSGRA